MKKSSKILLIIVIFLIIFLFKSNCTAQNSEEVILEQQKELGIQDFLESSKEYSGQLFEDIDMSEVLNDAIKGEVDNSSFIKRILKWLGSGVIRSNKAIGSILIIIVIHSVL